MGRIGGENDQSNQQPPQFQQYQPPDTIDVPPPSYETFPSDQDMYPPESPPPPPSQQAPNTKPARPVPFPQPEYEPTKPVPFPPPQAHPPEPVPFLPPQAHPPPHPPFPTAQAHPPPPPSPRPNPAQVFYQQQLGWKTGLFGCMENPTNALITACFPCLTFGQIAEIIDQGQTSCGTSGTVYCLIAFCIAMPCIMSCTYRTKLRSRFALPESPAPDCITHCFCECCALCQAYRELQARGIDPSIGWQGNVVKIQQQVAMMPPMNQRMRG